MFKRTGRFKGQMSSLAEIGDFVVSSAKKVGLGEAEIYAVELAVDEACTNIIEHAYREGEAGDIICTVQETQDGVKVILKDYGYPFDPDQVPQPDFCVPLNELKDGGAGIYLICHLMDEVKYEFSAQSGNTLTMFKRKATTTIP